MAKKPIGLFDHIKHITEQQTVGYWDTLSDTDKKTFSVYMVHRFLSMEMNWIELVNELQKYNLRPQEVYRFYIDILPKGKKWLKYIGAKKGTKYDADLVEMLSKYFEVGNIEIYDYIEILSREELAEIIDLHGVEKKEKTKMLKGIK